MMSASAFAQTDYNPFLKVVANSEAQYKKLLSDLLVDGNGEKWHAGAGQAYFEFFNHVFPGESPESIIVGTKFVSANTLTGSYEIGMLHKKTRELDWWERPWRTGERIGVYKGIVWTSMSCGNIVAEDIPLVEPNDYTKKKTQVAKSVEVVEKVVEVPVMSEKLSVVEKVVEVPVMIDRVEYVPYPVSTPQPQPIYQQGGGYYDPYYDYYGYGGNYGYGYGITKEDLKWGVNTAIDFWLANSVSKIAKGVESGAMRGGDVYITNTNTNTNNNNSHNRGSYNRDRGGNPGYDNSWPNNPDNPDDNHQGPGIRVPDPGRNNNPGGTNDNTWAVAEAHSRQQVTRAESRITSGAPASVFERQQVASTRSVASVSTASRGNTASTNVVSRSSDRRQSTTAQPSRNVLSTNRAASQPRPVAATQARGSARMSAPPSGGGRSAANSSSTSTRISGMGRN